jgi:hypothetical protein
MFNREVLQITEVLGRAAQGITRPFICRGDDGNLYFVKGANAGRKSLLAEWFGSSMAAAFGLPVAPFSIAEVDEALIDIGAPGLELAELGAGHVFASRAVQNPLELTWTNLSSIDSAQKLDVIVFDWWVRNQDRILTPLGGNPNLLWDPAATRMVVIDQNQAFDPDFDQTAFLELHAFAGEWHLVFEDFVHQQTFEMRMQNALEQFEQAYDKMPDSWQTLGGDDVLLGFTPEQAYELLLRYRHEDFWKR